MKMYPNLRAEMARNSMTVTRMSSILGMRQATLSNKMNGHSPFYLNEALEIKAVLGVDVPLEELFAND